MRSWRSAQVGAPAGAAGCGRWRPRPASRCGRARRGRGWRGTAAAASRLVPRWRHALAWAASSACSWSASPAVFSVDVDVVFVGAAGQCDVGQGAGGAVAEDGVGGAGGEGVAGGLTLVGVDRGRVAVSDVLRAGSRRKRRCARHRRCAGRRCGCCRRRLCRRASDARYAPGRRAW